MPCNICFNDILTNSLQCTHCLTCVHHTRGKVTITQFHNLDNFHSYYKDCIEHSPDDTNDHCLNQSLNNEISLKK